MLCACPRRRPIVISNPVAVLLCCWSLSPPRPGFLRCLLVSTFRCPTMQAHAMPYHTQLPTCRPGTSSPVGWRRPGSRPFGTAATSRSSRPLATASWSARHRRSACAPRPLSPCIRTQVTVDTSAAGRPHSSPLHSSPTLATTRPACKQHHHTESTTTDPVTVIDRQSNTRLCMCMCMCMPWW